MASVISNLAHTWNLTQNETLLYGRINDIFVNLSFDEHNKQNVNMMKPDPGRPSLFFVRVLPMQPKYKYVTVSLYVKRSEEIDIPELSGFLDTHYENFKTSLPLYVNGRFEIALYPRDSVKLKAGYIMCFLRILTEFLTERGCYSGCNKCGSTDSLTQHAHTGKATEICENCRLKEITL